ncbi:MAG TPA: alpha/beta hydrolase, partial [Verrucomicrobiae bacterium]|nr:alpha/beta hydrolase [Verrucomicrobiae bacterium]
FWDKFIHPFFGSALMVRLLLTGELCVLRDRDRNGYYFLANLSCREKRLTGKQVGELMEEELQLRIHGDKSLPTLIYLPGLHGDWTLIGGFLQALEGRVCFIEIAYPRTLVWSLDDYAAAIEKTLAQNGIRSGWLLGESFGSQPLWALVERGKFRAQAVILAGGFVRHPMRWAVRLAERLTGRMSNALFIWIIFNYAKIARLRHHRSPKVLARIDEFVERRTALDRRAAQHRLHLIAEFDPRAIARHVKLPVFCLSGIFDPIVPWPFVRRWLRRNCPALRDYKIICNADHNVLGTAAKTAAKQVLEWKSGLTATNLPAGKTHSQPVK